MVNKNGRSTRRPEATRQRILDGAGELFAASGFNGIGFRDIARKAGVSLQMPNHHFGTKKKLFAECVRHALLDRLDFPSLFAEAPAFQNEAEAKRALAEKIRACFFAVHPPSGRPSWCGEILGRALTENLQDALGAFQDGLRPSRDWFLAAVLKLQPDWTRLDALLWYISLWAQVSFYVTGRPAILARAGLKRYDQLFLQSAADHLVQVMMKQLENGGREK